MKEKMKLSDNDYMQCLTEIIEATLQGCTLEECITISQKYFSDVQNVKVRPTVQPIWWNDEILSLRREYIAARRKMTNARRKKNNDPLIEEKTMEYKSIKNRLKYTIREAKKQAAQCLIETTDKDSLANLPESLQGCTLSEGRIAEKSSLQPIASLYEKQENAKKCGAMSCQKCDDISDVQYDKVRPTLQLTCFNDEISSLRREYTAARRKMIDARRKKNNDRLIEEKTMEYRSIKNRLKDAIKTENCEAKTDEEKLTDLLESIQDCILSKERVRPTIQPPWEDDKISSLRTEYIFARVGMIPTRGIKNKEQTLTEERDIRWAMEYKNIIEKRLEDAIREAKEPPRLIEAPLLRIL